MPGPRRGAVGCASCSRSNVTVGRASSGLRAVEINGHRPLAHAYDDAIVWLSAGIALAVDDALRDEHEVPWLDLHPLGPARAELDEEPPASDVPVGVVAGMDVPVRGLVRGILDTPHPDALVRERLESGNAGRRRRLAAELAPRDHLRSVHVPASRTTHRFQRGRWPGRKTTQSEKAARPVALDGPRGDGGRAPRHLRPDRRHWEEDR